MFLRSNALEQLEFKLEKIIGIKKPTGKVKKVVVIPAARIGKRNRF